MTRDEVRFDGRAILVTGAGRGMGLAHARLLAARGAKVVIADNGAAMDGADQDTRLAASAVAEILDAGGEAVACTVDIATEAGSNEAVAASLDAYGRIDGILHNASTAPDLASAGEISSNDLEVVMRVNPFAGLWMTRAAWPHMARQKYGRIVYLTSGAGIYGAAGNGPYAAAKASYIGIMRSLVPDGTGHGIMINTIAPIARTRMTDRLPPSDYSDWFAQVMQPEKVSVGAVFLMSEECHITGELFGMGGGHISRMQMAESEGVSSLGDTIEQVRAAMPAIMADTNFFRPRDLDESMMRISQKLGYGGDIGGDAFAARPIEKD